MVQPVPINTLPENVLLEIFNSYRQISHNPGDHLWKWDTLIWVCQKWRDIILASLCCLELWLLCTHRMPVRRILDYWPPFHIIIRYCTSLQFMPPFPEDKVNVIAALEHHDRVLEVQLAVTSSLLRKIFKLMQVSFLRLTSLSLWLDKRLSSMVLVLPNVLSS